LWVTWHCHLDSNLREKREFFIGLGYSSRQERQVRKFILFLCGLCVFAGDNPNLGCRCPRLSSSCCILLHMKPRIAIKIITSNIRAIDCSVVRRYSSRQRKRVFGCSGFSVKKYSPPRHRVRRDRRIFYQELFTLRPQRLRGAISEPCFTGKPEDPKFLWRSPPMW